MFVAGVGEGIVDETVWFCNGTVRYSMVLCLGLWLLLYTVLWLSVIIADLLYNTLSVFSCVY